MGDQDVKSGMDSSALRSFEKALLEDLHALETLLDSDRFDVSTRRIGAEQELVLIDQSQRPAMVGQKVLERISDPRLVTELAQWNVEANLSPRTFGGRCLYEMEQELIELVGKTQLVAEEVGAHVLLTGILPTLRQSDLTLANMTPNPRYHEMAEAVKRLRGTDFLISIKGLDELEVTHDNIMLEACNTSFQVHFQVGPSEFAKLYNLAQVVSAPVLAAAVNSPVLFGRRLWRETRLAVFERSVDTRREPHHARRQPPRVHFGSKWVEKSILEIYREDVARFRVILHKEPDADPRQMLAEGRVPDLSALRLHTSTCWRWNRACYGVVNNVPHLRIENRVLPSGPTIRDEISNAAFYFGLMASVGDEYGDITKRMPFDDAKNNFLAAAQHGLKAQFHWVDDKQYSAPDLILNHLLPLARKGLEHRGLDTADIDAYLGTVEDRVRSGQTGSQWILRSLQQMGTEGTHEERFRAVTAAMHHGQVTGEPVHTWPLAKLGQSGDWRPGYRTVGQFMSTDLFTVRPEDAVNLAANLMEWERLRYLLVEDDHGELRGLLSHHALMRLATRGELKADKTVRDIMKSEVLTVTPNTPTLEAMSIMREKRIGCLPVVENHKVVGILTAHDFLDVATRIMEQHLREEG